MFTMQEAYDGLLLLSPMWYSLYLDGKRYGNMHYRTLQEAQFVCGALQEAYDRNFYNVTFTIIERDRHKVYVEVPL